MFSGCMMAVNKYSVFLIYAVLATYHCSPHSHQETVPDGSIPRRVNAHMSAGKHNFEFDHESVLGSHDAAEEFDQLSPEESKRRLKILAYKMDKNSDGFVDKAELTEWVVRSFEMLTEEEALDQLEDEDNDNDGKITWQEHVAETYSIFDDSTIDTEDAEKSEDFKMMQNDKDLFQAADLNSDGILDKKEFPAFSHPEEFEHMHQVLYEHAMEKRDKNGDDYLTFEEFITDNQGGSPVPGSEQYMFEKDNFENTYDQDNDGKLNREEVLQWLIPNSRDAAEVEAEHLIESSDEDKNGKLSIEEIVEHYEIFVGSEATDFGEHLHNTHKFTDEL